MFFKKRYMLKEFNIHNRFLEGILINKDEIKYERVLPININSNKHVYCI